MASGTIQKITDEVLWEGCTAGNVTFSKSASGYKYIEITYGASSQGTPYSNIRKIIAKVGAVATLMTTTDDVASANTGIILCCKRIQTSASGITVNRDYRFYNYRDNASWTYDTNTFISIMKVVGKNVL